MSSSRPCHPGTLRSRRKNIKKQYSTIMREQHGNNATADGKYWMFMPRHASKPEHLYYGISSMRHKCGREGCTIALGGCNRALTDNDIQLYSTPEEYRWDKIGIRREDPGGGSAVITVRAIKGTLKAVILQSWPINYHSLARGPAMHMASAPVHLPPRTSKLRYTKRHKKLNQRLKVTARGGS